MAIATGVTRSSSVTASTPVQLAAAAKLTAAALVPRYPFIRHASGLAAGTTRLSVLPRAFVDREQALAPAKVSGLLLPSKARVAGPANPLSWTGSNHPALVATSGTGASPAAFPGVSGSQLVATPSGVNRYQYMLVLYTKAASTVADPTALTAYGLTYTKVASGRVQADGLAGASLWRASGRWSGVAGIACTLPFTSTLCVFFNWDVWAAAGSEVQVVGGEGIAGTAATWSLTSLPVTGLVLAAVLCRNNGSTTPTPRANWLQGATQFNTAGAASPLWTAGLNDQTAGATWGANQTWVGLAAEIRAKALVARQHAAEALLTHTATIREV